MLILCVHVCVYMIDQIMQFIDPSFCVTPWMSDYGVSLKILHAGIVGHGFPSDVFESALIALLETTPAGLNLHLYTFSLISQCLAARLIHARSFQYILGVASMLILAWHGKGWGSLKMQGKTRRSFTLLLSVFSTHLYIYKQASTYPCHCYILASFTHLSVILSILFFSHVYYKIMKALILVGGKWWLLSLFALLMPLVVQVLVHVFDLLPLHFPSLLWNLPTSP